MNITMMECVQLLPQGKENYTQACTKRFQVIVITYDRTLHHYHNRYTKKHQKYQLFLQLKIEMTCYLDSPVLAAFYTQSSLTET